MAKKSIVSSIDKKWQAESDARTMAEYEAIMADNSRRRAAVSAAMAQAADLTKRANVMSKVAGTSRKK